MEDVKIVIDAGHGGSDSGASYAGIKEKDLTLKISKYMYEKIKSLGIPVAITREEDITLAPNERVSRILNAFGNTDNVVVISNHINSNDIPNSAEGAEVIYALRNDSTLANEILNGLGNAGQIKRKIYQRKSEKNPNNDYYFIHRETKNTEPVIVEYGFINNDNDLKKIEENYMKYADAVVDSVIKAKNIKTKYNMYDEECYIVTPGDTLWGISQKYGVSVSGLKNANNLTSDLIYPGQKLMIPKDDVNSMYVVKPGDTLWKISKMYGTTVENLASYNNLNNEVLGIGQILMIPTRGYSSKYTVQKGDTLWLIAMKYGVSVDSLKRVNNLTDNIIYIGQVLDIPNDIENVEPITYVVGYGDTLWLIAKRYGLTVDRIKQINGLTNDYIMVGQKLKLY